jgi:hypothetical protein
MPLILLGTGALALLAAAQAAQPKIDLIELFLTDRVLIHFETEANLIYQLQFTETLTTNGVPGGTWTNLYVAPNLPFPNHYVIVDTRMRNQRFYRLCVLP